MSRVHYPSPGHACPRCFGSNVRLSRLRRWENLLIPLLVRPYRCRDCEFRFWRMGWALKLVAGQE